MRGNITVERKYSVNWDPAGAQQIGALECRPLQNSEEEKGEDKEEEEEEMVAFRTPGTDSPETEVPVREATASGKGRDLTKLPLAEGTQPCLGLHDATRCSQQLLWQFPACRQKSLQNTSETCCSRNH